MAYPGGEENPHLPRKHLFLRCETRLIKSASPSKIVGGVPFHKTSQGLTRMKSKSVFVQIDVHVVLGPYGRGRHIGMKLHRNTPQVTDEQCGNFDRDLSRVFFWHRLRTDIQCGACYFSRFQTRIKSERNEISKFVETVCGGSFLLLL